MPKYMELMEEAQKKLEMQDLDSATALLEEGAELLKAKVETEPSHWEGYYHLGHLYELMGELEKSVESYRKSIEFAPTNEYRPDLNLAAVMIEMEERLQEEQAMGAFDTCDLTREATHILRRIIPSAEPRDWRPRYNLALAYTKLGEFEKANELVDSFQFEAAEKEVREAMTLLSAHLHGEKQQERVLPTLSSEWDAVKHSI